VGRFEHPPKQVCFFFIEGASSEMKEGTGTSCFAALEVKYSMMRALGSKKVFRNFTSEKSVPGIIYRILFIGIQVAFP
jgi:hypothetical protein